MVHPREIRPGIRRLFRLALRRPDDAAADMDDEIRLHLALRTEQLIREGRTPVAARAEAEARFGAPDGARGRTDQDGRRSASGATRGRNARAEL